MDATGLVAVAFIALGQHFSEGVVAYDKEDFTLATKSFTTVIDTAHRDSPYTEIALLWRARALGSQKRSVAAERDLDRLLQRDLDPKTRTDALAFYQHIIGHAWIGLQLISPESTWAFIGQQIKARNAAQLTRCFTGALLENTTRSLTEANAWDAMQSITRMQIMSIDYDEPQTVATVTLRADDDRIIQLQALKRDKFWLYAREIDAPKTNKKHSIATLQGAQTDVLPDHLATDIDRLNALRKAIETHVLTERQMPVQLSELTSMLGADAEATLTAENGKPYLMRTPTQGVEAPASPWVFPDAATNGKRAVLALGTVRRLAEEEFVRIANAHGIGTGPVSEIPCTAKDVDRLRQYIRDLGAEDYAVRREAERQLRAAGPKAHDLLEDATKHDDPEIAFQAQALLDAFK
ncbi:MAG: hypothetical protein ACI9OU_000246 [Candidatus Promineifilaceae bacterium]|jgi:hypothetical protein